MASGAVPLACKVSLGLIQMAELGLQELQKGEVEEYQGLQEMEGVEGFHQEEGEGEVAFLVLQAREEEVGGCQHPQAKGEVGGCRHPQAEEGVGGWQHPQAKGEGEVEGCRHPQAEEGVGGCRHPQAEEGVGGYRHPQAKGEVGGCRHPQAEEEEEVVEEEWPHPQEEGVRRLC